MMLYTVTTKTPKKKKESSKTFKYDYHIFIVKAESDKEIRDKFKASWPEHKIVDLAINSSNIIEV
jgi:hypothetical protein